MSHHSGCTVKSSVGVTWHKPTPGSAQPYASEVHGHQQGGREPRADKEGRRAHDDFYLMFTEIFWEPYF